MKALTLAVMIAAAPLAAVAEPLVLSAPMSGGTVLSEAADLSVYWLPAGDAIEVVAHYVTADTAQTPQRLRMRLEEGDNVTFGLPGVRGVVYGFRHEAGALVVTPSRTAPLIN